MAYCSGDLREHMSLLKKTNTVDTEGFKRPVWAPVYESVACQVSGVSARDFYQAYAAGAQNTLTFVCRFLADVNTSWRVSYLGDVYEIVQVNPLQEKRDFMALKCMRTKGE
ncbi:MAG: phage head closure protein [Clostridiales bacterium]|nr:phage head closure protein [Clostridiales bacterium]